MSEVSTTRSPVPQRMLYRALIRTAGVRAPGLAASLWERAWPRATGRMTGSTSVPIHGVDASVNTGYAYPAFYRRWHTYNDPLVQLVLTVREARDRPLCVVDVGAAVGDTVLLLLERAAGCAGRFVCLEPDAEFFEHLSTNLGQRDDVELVQAMLSDSEGLERAVVRTHSGTASAQGTSSVQTTTLDRLLGDDVVDVLKIDTDGFDGTVLRGAGGVLAGSRPAVIFEWHPILAEQTGQSWTSAFEALRSVGYRWFVWFTKEGEFSHFSHDPDAEDIADMAAMATGDLAPRPDWHYDVVALADGDADLRLEVASLRAAAASRLRADVRDRRSPARSAHVRRRGRGATGLG